MSSPVPEDLLRILRCPACVTSSDEPPEGTDKGKLELRGDGLVCLQCGRRFKVEDGIPNMLLDEAEMPEKTGS